MKGVARWIGSDVRFLPTIAAWWLVLAVIRVGRGDCGLWKVGGKCVTASIDLGAAFY